MRRTRFSRWPCSIARAVDILGDWWTPIVLREAFYGVRRFDDFQSSLKLSRNVLAQRLAALEAAHLVVAEPYSLRPPRMRYALTNDGRGLAGPLSALSAWGAQRDIDTDIETNGDSEFSLVHSSCGTPLETAWRCPTCDVDVDLHVEAPSASLDDTNAERRISSA